MSLARVIRSRGFISQLTSGASLLRIRQSSTIPSSRELNLSLQQRKQHLLPSSPAHIDQKRHLFTKAKKSTSKKASQNNKNGTSKVEFLDISATADGKNDVPESVLDGLTHEQQDVVIELNKYLRNDKVLKYEEVSRLVYRLIDLTNVNETQPQLIEYLLQFLNRIKYATQAHRTTKQVLRDEPVKLNEMFNNDGLFNIFQWISKNILVTKLDIHKSKTARLIIPELFISIRESTKDVKRLALICLYFNQFLLHQKFYPQSLENVKFFLQVAEHGNIGDREYLRKFLLTESINDLSGLKVEDSSFIFQLFTLLNSQDNELNDAGVAHEWFKIFLSAYNTQLRDKASNEKFIDGLTESQILSQFVAKILEYSNVQINIRLLQELQESNLGQEVPLVLSKVTDYLKNSVFTGKDTSFILDEQSFVTIFDASISTKDSYLINEELVALYRMQNPKDDQLTKNAWDKILAWKVFKSFGNDFADNNSLVEEIDKVSKYEMLKEPQEQEVKEVDGEMIISLSIEDLTETNKSFINVSTLNQLLQASSLSGKSANYIDSLIEYFTKWDVTPDATSYTILIQKGIDAESPIDAKNYYQMSLNSGVQWTTQLNLDNGGILYKLVQFLFSKAENYDQLNDAFRFFSKLKNFIEEVDVNTISVILKKFLQFDYVGDAIELLDKEFISSEDSTTSKYFGKVNEEDIFNLENASLNARKVDLGNDYSHKIFNTLYQFFFETNNSEVAWVVYGTIHRCFINVPFESYLPVLRKFNELERPDAAMLVFQQMKKMNRLFGLPPPNESHYVYLLQAFGEMCYETGIIELHTLLKMDLSVDTNIQLNNALLSAYTNLQDFMKTRDLFEQLLAIPTSNKNAVNSDTINIMLKAYTYGSINHVKAFWNNLSAIDYIPNEDNYKQFVISNCYHGKYEDAIALIDEMQFNGLQVKADVIKELYNWTENKDAKETVKQWILGSEHSDKWSELENKGLLEHSGDVSKEKEG